MAWVVLYIVLAALAPCSEAILLTNRSAPPATTLSGWSDWSSCSRGCSSGHAQRTRLVAMTANGTGNGTGSNSSVHTESRDCNTQSCMSVLPTGRQFLRCTAMIDLIILLDGSGSIGEHGFNQAKAAVQKIVAAMQGGDYGVKLGLLLFSGPTDWDDYEVCSGQSMDRYARPDPKTCGINWISRLTTKISDVELNAHSMTWPAGSSLMAKALLEAKANLIYGRQSAASVVVVLTDAQPVSPLQTGQAAEDLKNVARLVWMPLGQVDSNRLEDVKQWASMPWQDNMLHIHNLNLLNQPDTINSMIASFCPRVA